MKKIKPLKIEFRERKHRMSLTLVFSLIVFTIIFAAVATAIGFTYLLVYLGVMGDIEEGINLGMIFLFVSIFSVVLGAVAAFFSSRIPLKPVNTIINKMNRLAAGDFKTRLEFGSALSSHPAFVEISDSFNKMAQELDSTEMLRSDFINNFSHEFKTPIVSIAGLAKLVNKGELDDEQRKQYLRAIEEESVRLSNMATNVLNLTKVENQTILSDISDFNLSEQIRGCVLLLENKWEKKEIDIRVDFNEYYVRASEELLKQVWINLLDNAVKFAEYGGIVSAEIRKREEDMVIEISNTGSEVSEENLNKIFNKFYQADESHSGDGNGVGLAIVKRIVELHGGKVFAKSEKMTTTFTVIIPEKAK